MVRYSIIAAPLSTWKGVLLVRRRRLTGLDRRVMRLFQNAGDRLGHSGLDHDPRRTVVISAAAVLDEIVGRKIVEGDGGNVTHAAGAPASMLVSIRQQLFHNRQYSLVVGINDVAIIDSQ